MTPLYWTLKAVDVFGVILLLWAIASDAHLLLRLIVGVLAWMIASICGSLEERWKEKGWLTLKHEYSQEPSK